MFFDILFLGLYKCTVEEKNELFDSKHKDSHMHKIEDFKHNDAEKLTSCIQKSISKDMGDHNAGYKNEDKAMETRLFDKFTFLTGLCAEKMEENIIQFMCCDDDLCGVLSTIKILADAKGGNENGPSQNQ